MNEVDDHIVKKTLNYFLHLVTIFVSSWNHHASPVIPNNLNGYQILIPNYKLFFVSLLVDMMAFSPRQN